MIGQAIKAIRKPKITATELAAYVGISKTSLSLIESGRKQPSQSNLEKICRGLDITLPYLYMTAGVIGLENNPEVLTKYHKKDIIRQLLATL